MGSRLGICPNIFRVLFCIVNLLILVLGLLGIALSIYLIVVNNNYAFITGNNIISGAVLVLIGSIATVVIAGFGFVGAAFKWRPILVTYVAILLIIVLFEIIAAIVIFVFRNNLGPLAQEQLSDAIEEQISLYRRNQDPEYQASINLAVDFIQNTFRCCGAGNSSHDWALNNSAYLRNNGNMLPPSCSCTIGQENCARVTFDVVVNGTHYGMVNQTAWDNSCVEGTREAVFALALFGGGICIALGILEFLGVLVGLGLCICITTANKDQQVV